MARASQRLAAHRAVEDLDVGRWTFGVVLNNPHFFKRLGDGLKARLLVAFVRK